MSPGKSDKWETIDFLNFDMFLRHKNSTTKCSAYSGIIESLQHKYR